MGVPELSQYRTGEALADSAKILDSGATVAPESSFPDNVQAHRKLTMYFVAISRRFSLVAEGEVCAQNCIGELYVRRGVSEDRTQTLFSEINVSANLPGVQGLASAVRDFSLLHFERNKEYHPKCQTLSPALFHSYDCALDEAHNFIRERVKQIKDTAPKLEVYYHTSESSNRQGYSVNVERNAMETEEHFAFIIPVAKLEEWLSNECAPMVSTGSLLFSYSFGK